VVITTERVDSSRAGQLLSQPVTQIPNAIPLGLTLFGIEVDQVMV
jgi:hypothetical protein